MTLAYFQTIFLREDNPIYTAHSQLLDGGLNVPWLQGVRVATNSRPLRRVSDVIGTLPCHSSNHLQGDRLGRMKAKKRGREKEITMLLIHSRNLKVNQTGCCSRENNQKIETSPDSIKFFHDKQGKHHDLTLKWEPPHTATSHINTEISYTGTLDSNSQR